jgi:hypothetical protein
MSFLGSWGCRLFLLQALSSAFGIVVKAPCFVPNDNFWPKIYYQLARKVLFCFYKNWSLIFATRHRNCTSYQRCNYHTTGISVLQL